MEFSKVLLMCLLILSVCLSGTVLLQQPEQSITTSAFLSGGNTARNSSVIDAKSLGQMAASMMMVMSAMLVLFAVVLARRVFSCSAGGKALLPTATRPQLPMGASGKAWIMPPSIDTGMYHSQHGMQQAAAAGVWQLVYVGKALLPTANRPNPPTVNASTDATDGLCIDVMPAVADQAMGWDNMCPFKWIESERLRRGDPCWVPTNPRVVAEFKEAMRHRVLNPGKYGQKCT